MKIGIIGAGQIGAALIRQYSKAGHDVKMTNASGVNKLKAIEDETGAKAVSLAEVVTNVDILVISIPLLEMQAKSLVATLVNDSGFDTLDLGNLQASWRQQPGSPVYCTDLNLSQLKSNFRSAKRELLPGRREIGLQFILQQAPEPWLYWWKDCAANNRVIYETVLSQ